MSHVIISDNERTSPEEGTEFSYQYLFTMLQRFKFCNNFIFKLAFLNKLLFEVC